MNRPSLCGLVTVVLTGTAAQAKEIYLSSGAMIASDYVSSGIRSLDGPAVQPYAEPGFGGFHTGAYALNVDADLTAADIENGLSPDHRGAAGGFSFIAGIAPYLHGEALFGPSVEDEASGSLAVTEMVFVTASAAIAPDDNQTNLSRRVDGTTLVEGQSIAATVGWLEANCGLWTCWPVDATHAVAAQVSLRLGHHGTNIDPTLGLFDTDGLFVVPVTAAI